MTCFCFFFEGGENVATIALLPCLMSPVRWWIEHLHDSLKYGPAWFIMCFLRIRAGHMGRPARFLGNMRKVLPRVRTCEVHVFSELVM